jgi:hypothetical protein
MWLLPRNATLGLVLRTPSVLSALAFLLCGAPHVAEADPIDACIAAAEEGQRLRLDKELTLAREKLLACSHVECPTVLRADCTRWLSQVDAAMPSLVVRAVDATGADLVDVRLFVDDRIVAVRLDGSDLYVDPGVHAFRLVLADGSSVEEKVLVREGERHRILSVVFAAPRRDDGPTGGEERHTSPDRAIPSSPTPSLAAPIATFAAGGVALGIASYFWITGLDAHATLGSTCAPTHSCAESSVESAHDKLVIGDVAGGIGLGLAAIGVGLLILRGHAARPSLVVAFSQAPGGALLSLGGDL